MKRATRSSSTEDPGAKNKRPKKRDGTKAGSGFDTRWKFKIEPQPPKFPFCNEFFALNVYMVDQKGVLQPNIEVPISLELFVEGESVPVVDSAVATGPKGCVEIDEATPACIDKTGCAKIRVKVCELSMNRNNRKFCFVIRRKPGPRPDNLPHDINPTMTRPMLVINSQIRIMNTIPKVWYKDQGGRDKCIELDLELHGPNSIVTGHEVPVRCVLLYEDTQVVLNQKVLQPIPTSPMIINKTGRSQIRVRIEDVSKNHQSRNFRIKVEPDTSKSPIHFDKSPDISSPVLVRSKLNRRQRERMQREALVEARVAAPGSTASVTASGTPLASLPLPEGLKTEAAAVRDLRSFPPEVATALWCKSARDMMAMFSNLLGQFVQNYDTQVHPHVAACLDRHGGFAALTSEITHSSSTDSNSSSSSISPPPPPPQPGSAVQLLPSESDTFSHAPPMSAPLASHMQQPPLERSESNSSTMSQQFAQLLRGTTQLVRGMSGLTNVNNVDYYNVGPAAPEFSRGISLLSLAGNTPSMSAPGPGPAPNSGPGSADDPFASVVARVGNVPRMHSLAIQAEDGTIRRHKSTGSSAVSYILREIYSVGDNIKGIPAFDASKRLVGFYAQSDKAPYLMAEPNVDPAELVAFRSVEHAFQDVNNPQAHIKKCERAIDEDLAHSGNRVTAISTLSNGYIAAGEYLRSGAMFLPEDV